MRSKWLTGALLGFGLLCTPLVLEAAEAQFKKDGETYTLRTNTSGGTCTTTTIIKGGMVGSEVACKDGDVEAVGDTIDGCVSIAREGLCAKGTPPVGPEASTQVNCTGGVTYNISTGDTAGSCTTSGSGGERSGSCSSTGSGGQTNMASASCANGCGDTQGSGCCCQAGTSGCGPGTSCHS